MVSEFLGFIIPTLSHYFFFLPLVVLPIFSLADLKLGHLLFCYVIKCWSPIYVEIEPSVLSF